MKQVIIPFSEWPYYRTINPTPVPVVFIRFLNLINLIRINFSMWKLHIAKGIHTLDVVKRFSIDINIQNHVYKLCTKNKKLDHHELLDDIHCLSIYYSSSHMVVSFCETQDRLCVYVDVGRLEPILSMCKTTYFQNRLVGYSVRIIRLTWLKPWHSILKIQSLCQDTVWDFTQRLKMSVWMCLFTVSVGNLKQATQNQCDMWQPKGVHINLYDCSSGALYGMRSSNS